MVTGRLQRATRSQIEARIKELGGVVLDAVTKKTDYLVVGEDAGSKLAKAQKLARVAAMTPEQRRRHYEQGLRAQLQRRAGVVPVHRRTAWIDEKVSAAMQRFDAGRAPVEEGSK